MNPSLFAQSLMGLLFFIAGTGLFVVVAASVSDFQAITKRRSLRTVVAKLRKSRQPHITVLVYAKGNVTTIEACLESIRRSYYQNYDCVVVVDTTSSDTMRQIVRQYGRKYPKLPLRVSTTRKIGDRSAALHRAYGKSQKGDVICILDATSTIRPTVLKECAARFMVDRWLQALRLNERSDDVDGVTALSTRFLQLSRHQYLKLLPVLSLGRQKRMLSGMVYRASVFTDKNLDKKIPYRYVGSLVVSAQSVRVTKITLVMVTVALLSVTYFMYLAASLRNSHLLVLSWLVLVVWLLLIVWSDEVSRIREKIVLTFCVPAFYFLLYAQLIVQGGVGIVRTLGLTSKSLPK